MEAVDDVKLPVDFKDLNRRNIVGLRSVKLGQFVDEILLKLDPRL